MLKRFIDCRRGTYAVTLAVLCPVLISAMGLGVDYATLTGAKAKLQDTLDGALLAASRLKESDGGRDQLFKAFLDVHLANDPAITSYASALSVQRGVNSIETKGQVTAQVKLFIMGNFGLTDESLKVTSTAHESTDTLEVAMVLDNTGSMGAAGMKALREAATAMNGILETASQANRQVKAALVPFVTAVNVKGAGYKSGWIDALGLSPLHGVNFEPRTNHLYLFQQMNVTWKGCVEARPAPHNLDDTAPDATKPETLFVPYLAPDNPGAAERSPNKPDLWNNSYLTDAAGNKAQQRSVSRYLSSSATARFIEEDKGTRTTGPNYACASPIEPLTKDFDAIQKAINQMIHWEGSGTNVAEGLAWGMRVLSPQEPYSQGAAFTSDTTSKVVVVFTDGENNVFGASSQGFNTSDYGAYGFLDSNRMGSTNRATALTNVNTWTQTMCTRLKDKGVQIFTVLLGADTAANRTLYSQCASTPDKYYPTKDISELKVIFAEIAKKVANLHLTQ